MKSNLVNNRMRVNINIDKLVLNGFEFNDKEEVEVVIRQELDSITKQEEMRNLLRPDMWLQNNHDNQIPRISRVEGGFDSLTGSPSKEEALSIIGKGIARSIYNGLKSYNHSNTMNTSNKRFHF
jgi:hypothetical protein